MNLQHLEDQVAAAEERALQISLSWNSQQEVGELTVAWQNIHNLETEASKHGCYRGRRVIRRLASVRADLDGIVRQRALSGKESLPPLAA